MDAVKVSYRLMVLALLLVLCSCGEKEPENTPPVAYFTVGENAGTIETLFSFDASGSYDLEDSASALKIRWDWEDDGKWDTEYSTEKIFKKGFTKKGFYKVRLEVMDSGGLSSYYAEIINVEDYFLIDSRDQKKYRTVKVGNQLWMAENLSYQTFEGSWCHNNDPGLCGDYGRLYDWPTAQYVCPVGWRLPTMDDWELMLDFLGDNAGRQMKSDHGWQGGYNGTNSSGFNVLPASYRTQYGEFMALGGYAFFWSATVREPASAWSIMLSYNQDIVEKNYYNQDNAFSIRCIRN